MPIDNVAQNGSSSRRAAALFVLVCAVVAAGIGGYAVFGRRPAAGAVAASGGGDPVDSVRLSQIRSAPHVLFRITALGASYGRVGIVPVANPEAPPVVAPLMCDRLYASDVNGLCLQASRGVLTTYRAIAFDRSLAQQHEFTLGGAPSRTRVAPTAPLASATVFVSGDSYAAGGFSTRTTIFDLKEKRVVGDLETFAVTKDGQPFKRQDFNFWGVTFRDDGDRFYATLSTGGVLHLVEGSVAGRSMTVIGVDVECPSLSPDGKRVAYKARMVERGRVIWRLRVRDLATGAITELREARNIDDQAEWLDNGNILYALPREGAGSGSSDVWAASADGTGAPRMFIANAFSPAVVRR
jgi:hypothetical protein